MSLSETPIDEQPDICQYRFISMASPSAERRMRMQHMGDEQKDQTKSS